MEKWDLYDNNRQLTGKIIERGQNCPQNLCRLVIHICIFNKKGEMLIQQRQSDKKSWPNAWDITLGGCVQTGETSQQAAKRELREELGIEYDFSDVRPYMTINFDNGFDDFYLIEEDVPLNKITFKDNEVQAVKWATEEEILDMIKSKQFINYYPTFISALFEMKEARGVHKK